MNLDCLQSHCFILFPLSFAILSVNMSMSTGMCICDECRCWGQHCPAVFYIWEFSVWRAVFLIFSFWRTSLKNMKASQEEKILQNIQKLNKNFLWKALTRTLQYQVDRLRGVKKIVVNGCSLIKLWFYIHTHVLSTFILIICKSQFIYDGPPGPLQHFWLGQKHWWKAGAVHSTHSHMPKCTEVLLHHMRNLLHSILHNNNIQSY